MSLSDPIAQMLTHIRNAHTAKHSVVDVSSSKLKLAIANVLKEAGYIERVMVLEDGPQGVLRLSLKYDAEGQPVIRHISRVSRPGLRKYVGWKEIPRPLNGIGTVILSTPKGVKSGNQARSMRVGGEVLCTVW